MCFRLFIATTLLTLPLVISSQGNQGIFNGGMSDGFSVGNFTLSNSNPIFRGSTHDGFAAEQTKRKENSEIFAGGSGDGFDAFRTETPVSNPIFEGGIADGFDATNKSTTSNNDIFIGGIADGSDSEQAESVVNNKIFAGGIHDGFSQEHFQYGFNDIFKGGIADGFAQAGGETECTIITWIGTLSTSWDNPGNWDIGRTPTPCDLVIIEDGPHDPIVSNGSLGIDFFSDMTNRRALKLIIRPDGHLTLTEKAVMDIASEVRIEGLFASVKSLVQPVVTVHPGGEFLVKSGGVADLD